MSREPEDWAAVQDQMLEGSEPAALKLGRLITGFLASWRAYDFRPLPVRIFPRNAPEPHWWMDEAELAENDSEEN